MKVSYVENRNAITTLEFVEVGSVFCPINSQNLFIKLDRNAGSEIFTNEYNKLWANFIGGYAGEDFYDQDEFETNHYYNQLTLCADVVTGETNFIYEGIKVRVMKCELLVEET